MEEQNKYVFKRVCGVLLMEFNKASYQVISISKDNISERPISVDLRSENGVPFSMTIGHDAEIIFEE